MSELMCQAAGRLHEPRTATAAIDTGGFTGEPPVLACDECAVRKLMEAPGLGYRIISLGEWRERMRPVAEDAIEQLARARNPVRAIAGLPEYAIQAGGGPAHSHRAPVSPLRRWLAIGSGLALSIGVVLIVNGNNVNYTGATSPGGIGGTSGDPEIGVGIFLVASAVLYLIGRISYEIGKAAREGGRQYKRWMASLTPEQRTAVHFGEAAAFIVADHEMHEHNKREAERIAAMNVGREPRF